MKDNLTGESTKEKLVEFFSSNYKIKEDVKNNLLKEDISGEILSDLNDKELKSLGLKSGLILKLRKYISENKEKFEPKEITEKISIFSKLFKFQSKFK